MRSSDFLFHRISEVPGDGGGGDRLISFNDDGEGVSYHLSIDISYCYILYPANPLTHHLILLRQLARRNQHLQTNKLLSSDPNSSMQMHHTSHIFFINLTDFWPLKPFIWLLSKWDMAWESDKDLISILQQCIPYFRIPIFDIIIC